MNIKLLFDWYKNNARNLPWRETKNPYAIWISEIILQQTRVNQGLEYYIRFLNLFPTIEKLAEAEEREILKAWEGLGYYSRARNMHYTAKIIVKQYHGKFPENYDELLKLKGIGPYTAAAIASFAFNIPVPAIDGNVLRVLARLYGINIEINTSAGHRVFRQKSLEILDKKKPALFNQAMMEFGALQCVPSSPHCKECVFSNECIAYQTGKIKELPVKKKKKKPVEKYFHFFLIEKNNQFMIEKRTGKGIWKNLYQLPLIETEKERTILTETELNKLIQKYQISSPKKIKKITEITHLLSHQKLNITIWKLETSSINKDFIQIEEIDKHPFPAVIAKFLDNYFN